MPRNVLVVNEIYGPVDQGEGRHAGRPCIFLRLSRCNLDCSWCDTPYTWDWTGKLGVAFDPAAESHRVSVSGVVEALLALLSAPEQIVVVSGGEPLLQRKALTQLVDAEMGHEVHIETNGTRPAIPGVDWYSVSPKLLPSAGIDPAKAYVPDALASLADEPGAVKLVVDPAADHIEDIAAAVAQLEDTGWTRDRIDLMACGATPETLAQNEPATRSSCTALGLGFSPRLHVTLSGGGRGT